MTFRVFSEAERLELSRAGTPERFGFLLPVVRFFRRGERRPEGDDADEDLLAFHLRQERQGVLTPAHEGGRVGSFKGFGHEPRIEKRNRGILFAFAPGDGFGKRIFRGRAREHDAHKLQIEVGHAPHEGERRTALSEQRFRMGFRRKQRLPAADFGGDALFLRGAAVSLSRRSEGFLPCAEVGADEACGKRRGLLALAV